MIESPVGKASVITCLLILAGLLVVRSPQRKRAIVYPIAAVLAATAVYVGFRVKTWAPPKVSIVGDVDAFIAAVPSLEAEFVRRARPRGLPPDPSPTVFAEWIWSNRFELDRDWREIRRPLIAAYGEALRRSEPRAVWAKRGGDVVVEVPLRPWTRKRVALEVHDQVSSDV